MPETTRIDPTRWGIYCDACNENLGADHTMWARGKWRRGTTATLAISQWGTEPSFVGWRVDIAASAGALTAWLCRDPALGERRLVNLTPAHPITDNQSGPRTHNEMAARRDNGQDTQGITDQKATRQEPAQRAINQEEHCPDCPRAALGIRADCRHTERHAMSRRNAPRRYGVDPNWTLSHLVGADLLPCDWLMLAFLAAIVIVTSIISGR